MRHRGGGCTGARARGASGPALLRRSGPRPLPTAVPRRSTRHLPRALPPRSAADVRDVRAPFGDVPSCARSSTGRPGRPGAYDASRARSSRARRPSAPSRDARRPGGSREACRELADGGRVRGEAPSVARGTAPPRAVRADAYRVTCGGELVADWRRTRRPATTTPPEGVHPRPGGARPPGTLSERRSRRIPAAARPAPRRRRRRHL